MSQSTSAAGDVGELHENTQNIVKYILNNSADKLPIKRTDIVKDVLKGHSQFFSQCFNLAKTNLIEIYGINILEIPDGKKHYICVSCYPASSTHEYLETQKTELTLLFVILSYIFMKGGTILEMDLLKFLSRLKINTAEHHFYFNDVLKLIRETFPKQLYLKREKHISESAAEDEFILSWGFRSESEFPKKDILLEVAKIMGKSQVCFVQQYGEIYGNQDVSMENE